MKTSHLITILAFLIFLNACRKSAPQVEAVVSTASSTVTPPNTPVDPGNPNPANASIIGKIAPLDIAKTVTVTITNAYAGRTFTAKPNETGSFILSSLPAGPYQITVNRGFDLGNINLALVNLNGGQTKDIQTITLSTGNSLAYVVNGTSAITGAVSPVKAGSFAYAYHKKMLHQYTGTIDASGKFIIKDLPEGSYYVNVNPATNYTAKATIAHDLDLSINQTADAGSFLFDDNTDKNTINYLSYELDGVKKYRDLYYKAFYIMPKFSLYTYATGSVYMASIDANRSITTDRLDIIMDNISGPGTYALTSSAASIKLTHQDIVNRSGAMGSTRRAAGPISVWSTVGSGGSGTLTITAVDLVNKTISGTFTAVTVPESGAAKVNRVITNGSFSNFKYAE